MDILTQKIIQFLGSPTFGIVLSLLLIFQWYKQHAKDQAVKNSLFAMRRKVLRSINNSSSAVEKGKAHDMIDDIDAILATLNSRKPFSKDLNQIVDMITKRNNLEKQKELIELDMNDLTLGTLPLSITPTKSERIYKSKK